MVAILGLRQIQVKREIVRIITGICREGRRNFGVQRTCVHKKLCTVLVDVYLVQSTNYKN